MISRNNLSYHLTQHLYQYNIMTYRLRSYSEDRHVDRITPDYVMASMKYNTSLHITPESQYFTIYFRVSWALPTIKHQQDKPYYVYSNYFEFLYNGI